MLGTPHKMQSLIVEPANWNKVTFAKLVNAWEACKVRGAKRKNEEAEQRVGDMPLRLPKSAHLIIKKAFNAKHKELEAKRAPPS